MNRQKYQQQIIDALTWLSMKVGQNNSINLTDINHTAEYFYCGLLNLSFGYNLVNINILEPNSAAIDLGDAENRLAIQVTSTGDLTKTRYTIDKFIEKGLYKKYDRLIILNIVKKVTHKIRQIGDENYMLDTKEDIWDIGCLIKRINSKTDVKEQKAIADFLSDELKTAPPNTLSNEVSTILHLIEYISDESHPDAGNGYIEEPFPEDKVYKRFSDHSEFLEQKFYDGYLEYGAVLTAVKEEIDFGQVRLRRAARYLKDYSDRVLTSCNGNPELALQKIIENFSETLKSNGNKFDAGAAEFYVLEQLTQCNVFPNKN